MSKFEDIGRYHHLVDTLQLKVRQRNEILFRASRVMAAASEEQRNYGVIGKKCNFEAMERLTAEAKVLHEEILILLDEANALAPIVNKPELKLA